MAFSSMSAEPTKPRPRVAVFPESWRDNPVMQLMDEPLAARGVRFVRVGADGLGIAWLWRQRGQVDVLHLHWLHYHYQAASVRTSWAALTKFCTKLVLARLLGYRVVWTMHNLLPHERLDQQLDSVAAQFVARIATAVIVHCEEARRLLQRRYHRRERVFMAYLGHYIDAYPQRVDRDDARVGLRIAQDSLVFLFFGSVRPYKGIERLLEEFRALPNPRAQLVVAGRPLDEAYGAQIRELARADSRVRLVLEWIPDDELPSYFGAADAVVLPFNNILTSSSVLAAMSFGRTVIAPALGCIPEVVAPDCGVLYDPTEPAALGSALERCSRLNLGAMGLKALEQVSRFSWAELADKTVAAYTA